MLSKCKAKKFLICLILPGMLIMSGCSDIRLKPTAKDPELLALGKFAEQVTVHLLAMNPNTYQEYQADLVNDLAPDALAQLMTHGVCAKSASEAAKTAKTIEQTNQRCLIQIQSTSFPSRATTRGLVPVEVTGNCVKSQGYTSKGSKFDVFYLIGTNVKTKRPIVASVEIKQF